MIKITRIGNLHSRISSSTKNLEEPKYGIPTLALGILNYFLVKHKFKKDVRRKFIEVIYDNNNGFDFGQGEYFDVMELTEVGAVGEPVIGNFSGTVTNYAVNPPAAIEVTGEFNIIRQ